MDSNQAFRQQQWSLDRLLLCHRFLWKGVGAAPALVPESPGLDELIAWLFLDSLIVRPSVLHCCFSTCLWDTVASAPHSPCNTVTPSGSAARPPPPTISGPGFPSSPQLCLGWAWGACLPFASCGEGI